LSFSVVDLRLCALQGVLGLIEPGSGCMPVRQQLTLSVKVPARVGQLSPRGGERRFRRPQSIELILGVEFSQNLSRFDSIADIDGPFDHPPGDAKGKGGLVFGLDVPGQYHGFAGLSFGSRHRPNGAYFRRFDFRIRLTRGQDNGGGNQDQPSPRRTVSSHCESLTTAVQENA
jgi:hypothetical protein